MRYRPSALAARMPLWQFCAPDRALPRADLVEHAAQMHGAGACARGTLLCVMRIGDRLRAAGRDRPADVMRQRSPESDTSPSE